MQGKVQRITLIDALRGFALLGILLSHFSHWFVLGDDARNLGRSHYGFASSVAEYINECFIHGKFVVLFSFIFGLSFSIQNTSFKRHAANVNHVLLRRAFFLFLIGLVHFLFWWGDVLVLYGALMLPLIVLKKLSSRQLLIAAAVLIFNTPGMLIDVYHFVHMHHAHATAAAAVSQKSDEGRLLGFLSDNSIAHMLSYNISFFSKVFEYQVWSGSLFRMLGFFCLGIFVARKGLLNNVNVFQGKFALTGLGAAGMMAFLYWSAGSVSTTLGPGGLGGKMLTSIITAAQGFMALTLDLSIVSFLYFHRSTLKIAESLVPMGKMALTNYLMQTIIGLAIFYPVGMGLCGKTSPGANFLLAFAVYGFQVILSGVLVRYLNYGVVEWLLRAGTMLKFSELVKRGAPAPLAYQPGAQRVPVWSSFARAITALPYKIALNAASTWRLMAHR